MHRIILVALALSATLAVAEDKLPADKAVIVVKLPADATLTLNGEATKATGTERLFGRSDLKAGERYSYVLVATWKENGKERKEQQKVTFSGGETVPVVFPATKPAKVAKAAKNFTSRAGRFAADFPDKVKEATEDLGEGRKRFIFGAPGKGRNFQVSYFDLSDKLVKDREPAAILLAFRKGFREGKEFAGEKEITLDKVPGVEYRFDGDGASVRERLYLAGNRLYVVFVAAAKDKDFVTSKESDAFFDSFTLTK